MVFFLAISCIWVSLNFPRNIHGLRMDSTYYSRNAKMKRESWSFNWKEFSSVEEGSGGSVFAHRSKLNIWIYSLYVPMSIREVCWYISRDNSIPVVALFDLQTPYQLAITANFEFEIITYIYKGGHEGERRTHMLMTDWYSKCSPLRIMFLSCPADWDRRRGNVLVMGECWASTSWNSRMRLWIVFSTLCSL